VSALSQRPVLVLGGLGFIGSHLVDRLLTLGSRVTIVTPSRARHQELARSMESKGARIVEADVRDLDAMTAVAANQETVFNLSGQSGAVRSMEDPWTDLDVNCRGNLTVLEALRAVNRDATVVFVGSRLEYGMAEAQPVAEDSVQDPLCLHAIHKLTAERYLRLYRRLFGIRYAIARLTNPYGPGQPQHRTTYGVVNRLIHLALSDAALPIYGDGLQRRDYIYIDDAVGALIAIAESTQSHGRAYNVGTGVGTPLVEMAHSIIRAAGSGRIESVEWPPLAAQIETGDFVADIARIRDEIGWAPVVSLDEGLQRTVAFHRARVGC
jgi:UDP-glucose 4-epimerase